MLHLISVVFLVLSAISCLILIVDVLRHPQKMTIMNYVWPITALYFGPFALPLYFKLGRPSTKAQQGNGHHSSKPFWQSVTVGVTHCGAGCTLGDFAAEWIAFLSGFALLGSKLAGSYLLDFLLAYAIGVIFQYFSIAPMRNLSGWPGIAAAMKADTISLIAFEAGMFIWMAFTHHHFHPELKPTDPRYWFLMQIAMAVGFATSFPANWWLIRKGWKEAM